MRTRLNYKTTNEPHGRLLTSYPVDGDLNLCDDYALKKREIPRQEKMCLENQDTTNEPNGRLPTSFQVDLNPFDLITSIEKPIR